jgi:hypothetical protein
MFEGLRLNQCDRHPRSDLQNMERQFLGAFLSLRRLAVDKSREIAFFIFYEEIEVLLVDLSFFRRTRRSSSS